MAPTETTTATATTATVDPTHISNFDTGLAGVDQVQNELFKEILWWSLGVAGLIILSIRLLEIGWSQIRHVTAMSRPASGQSYWRTAQWAHMPWIKKYLTYAPISSKRHNREIRVTSALNMGTLPTRLQLAFLTLYLGTNLGYMVLLDYKESPWARLAELRGRSGTLAAVNMVPLIIFASRNNPLIAMLRISFDTYNLLHRWLGRIVVVESVIHTVAWGVVQVNDAGWTSVWFKMVHDRFIASGTIGTTCFLILVVVSLSPLRHAFYETFLVTHILLALVSFICIWVHCATSAVEGGLPQLKWMIAIVILWMSERIARIILNAYRSWSGRDWPDAVVEAMPGDCSRVTIHLPRFVNVKPGTHAYLRFLEINPWECHPFSIAWVQHRPKSNNIIPMTEKEARHMREERPLAGGEEGNDPYTGFNAVKNADKLRTSVSFVIGAQTGFTRKLLNRALDSGEPFITLKALVEGPYAGHHSLDSYGHAVLIAGATGITHQISYLRHLIQGYADGTVATRRVTLVWVVRDYEALEWIRPWMDEVLRMPLRHEILQLRIFVTRPKNPAQLNSTASRSIQMFPGRPNIPTLLRKEVAEQVGAMCVTVCGPGALADDVRCAVRDVLDEGTVVDFVEESFTW